MKTYQLHDFVDDYPCQNDPYIQYKTAQRREFNELASGNVVEKVGGRFFKHQELFLRYVRQYNRIFNIQETGTGKSGSIINVAEFYKKNNENIKRVYIIQPGPATANDFKNQIIKLSDENEYMNDKIKYANSKASITNNLTRLIKEWYSIETYQQFAKKGYTDKIIEEEFSDCVFFFDEAHKLRTLSDESSSISSEEINKIYDYIWRVCHVAKRTKIILATATPMINSTIDFIPLINLLLPMDFQLPFYKTKDNFYDLVTLEQLEPYFRGKITFIKFLESNIEVINVGEILEKEHKVKMASDDNRLKSEPLIPEVKSVKDNQIITINLPSHSKQPLVKTVEKNYKSEAKVVKLQMSEIQKAGYSRAKKSKKSFFLAERQASVFVYPNGSFGVRGFEQYTQKDEFGVYSFIDSQDGKGLNKFINEKSLEDSLNNLQIMSCKFHYYLTIELEQSKKEKPGNSFCYIEFVNASGALLLGMILRIFGFEEYQSNYSAFDLKTKKIQISKGKRFALLTGKQGNLQEILNLFNSYENRHGEYIQMLIASETARDGINIKNVLRGYIMTPVWHEAGMYQALSRFIRADSHDYLIAESGRPNVEIHRLCTMDTVDEKLYLDSELKNIRNQRVLKFMQMCAFDGIINYERNTLKDKELELWDGESMPPKNEYIYNTYYLYYVDNLIKEVKRKIIQIIRVSFFIDYDELKEKIAAVDYVYNTAIQELIYNKEIISNYQNTLYYILDFNPSSNLLYMRRENLYNNILNESTENDLYLDNEYPVLSKITYLEEGSEQVQEFLDKFGTVNETTAENIKNYYIESQNHLLFQKLLEIALIKVSKKETSALDEIILKMFSNYYIFTKKPTNYYSLVERAFSKESEKKQGRRRGENSMAGLKDIDLNKHKPEENDEMVIVHFYQPTSETAFAINTIFETDNRTIKIYEYLPSTGEGKLEEFRETDKIENFIYNHMFTEMYKRILAPFKSANFYGSYIMRGDTKSTIVEKEKNFFRIIDNTQDSSRGKVCTSFNINKIEDILAYLDINNKYSNLKKRKKPIICPILLELFRERKLLFESY